MLKTTGPRLLSIARRITSGARYVSVERGRWELMTRRKKRITVELVLKDTKQMDLFTTEGANHASR